MPSRFGRLFDGPVVPLVVMAAVTALALYAIRDVIAVWELAQPGPYRERPFTRARWESFAGYPVDNERGEMYADLVRRRILRTHDRAGAVLAVLGHPDERHGRTLYWLTGRWRGHSDTCLRIDFDRLERLVHYELVQLSERAALRVDCRAGRSLAAKGVARTRP